MKNLFRVLGKGYNVLGQNEPFRECQDLLRGEPLPPVKAQALTAPLHPSSIRGKLCEAQNIHTQGPVDPFQNSRRRCYLIQYRGQAEEGKEGQSQAPPVFLVTHI